MQESGADPTEAGARSRNNRWKDLKSRLLCFLQGGTVSCVGAWGFYTADHGPAFQSGADCPRENTSASSSSLDTTTLAAALAAERQICSASAPPLPQRERVDEESYQWEVPSSGGTTLKALLMEILAQGRSRTDVMEEEEEGPGDALCCCVCMRLRKTAAFIPCGHTFCRQCSRELRRRRGACPLCNRRILDVLDIF